MSFSAVSSYSAKGADMFVQGYEELGSDFFDQFLTYSPADDVNAEYPLPESTLLKKPLSHASLSSTDDENQNVVALESWQGDTWAVEDSTVASLSASADHFYTSGRAAISDSELLSLEGIYLESPQITAHPQTSLPSSPTQGQVPTLRRRNRIVESLSKTFIKASASLDKSILRSPIRKAKSNPAMMRTTHQNNSNLDLWGQKLDLEATKFNFDFEQNDTPVSAPPTARVPDLLQFSDSVEPQKGEMINGLSYKHTLTQHMPRPSAYNTPLSTPTLDHYPSRRTSQQLRSDSALFPITPQAQNASSSWSQLPNSPNFDTFGNSSVYPEINSPLWWNHAATAPMAQPSPNNFQTNPHRSSKSHALQLQNDLAYNNNSDLGYNPSGTANGLMIQMPDNPAQQSFGMGSSPMHPPQGYFPSSHSRPQPHHHHQQHQRANHNRQASHHARSRHQQQAQQQHQQQHHSSPIRKSRSGSSDSESPSPPAAFHVRKRKTPKSSKQSTPRTPTTGSATVDFVNYTPSDSRKILTGVAPSGSSKTKARREKEALDKRRKLSQAAMRAVRAAGGDVDSLVEQGLFV